MTAPSSEGALGNGCSEWQVLCRLRGGGAFGGSKPPPYREQCSIIMLSHGEVAGREMTLPHGEFVGVRLRCASRTAGQGALCPMFGGVGPEQGPTRGSGAALLKDGGSKPPPYRERCSITMLSHGEVVGREVILLHGEVVGEWLRYASRTAGQGGRSRSAAGGG